MNSRHFPFPADLPPTVALALFEVLQDLTDALWEHYETELIELLQEERQPFPDSQQAFDFDDELTF